MADVTLTYKGTTIAELSDSGSKTIRTAGKFCEADIGVTYVKPSGGGSTPTGTKQISITENGTHIEDVAGYANAEISVSVPSEGIIPSGTKQITVAENGTITEDVTNYAAVQVVTNVPSSGGAVDWNNMAKGLWPTGAAVFDSTVDTIPESRFQNYTEITSVYASSVTSVKANAFSGCSKIETINLPLVTELADYAFRSCVALKNLSIPEALTIGINAFQYAYLLEAIVLPKVTSLGSYAFGLAGRSTDDGCTIVLKAVATFGSDCFRGTGGKYKCIDIAGTLSNLPNRCFYQGTHYDIVLRKSDSIVTMGNTNAVGVGVSTGPNASTTFYVPASLLADYEANTNWSNAKATKKFSFATIEGSKYEGYWADGSPIS